MVFLKCTASLVTIQTPEEMRRMEEVLQTEVSGLTEGICDESCNRRCVFLAGTTPRCITLGIIAPTYAEGEQMAAAFLNDISVMITTHVCEEITYSSLNILLLQSERHDFISERDEIARRFCFDQLVGHGRPGFGESLIVDRPEEKIRATVQRHYFGRSMLPELERIAQGKATKTAQGHPVHYLIHSDDHYTRKELHQVLLSALYRHGRVRNRRYAYIDVGNVRSMPVNAVDALYHCNEGGTVIVRFNVESGEDGAFAETNHTLIEAVCDAAVRYKNTVLTILCLPRADRRQKDAFLRAWGDSVFVEFREDVIDCDRARRHLTEKAKALGAHTDRALMSLIGDEAATYTLEQLDAHFDKWYNHKLRHRIYPQYSEMTAKSTARPTDPVGSAYQRLQALIGLSEAKGVMDKALNFFKMQQLFARRGMSTDQPSMHMVFTGNPGTAKTTVARLFAEVMRENGLLDTDTFVEVGRAELVGKYVGHTAPLVQAAFAKAKGGVLFIDEAYSLVDDRNGLFGDEAINTIVQEMENHRQDTVVIFAGYPDKMEAFLDRNPGLRSRIAFHIPFADYSVDELCAIAAHMATQQGLTLTAEAVRKLRGVFAIAVKQEGYGNGRYVRNLIERARMAQADRLMRGDITAVTDEQLHTITAADIETPQDTAPAVTSIGFCA